MEEFIKGSVVIINYPFSDFSSQKKRPALVIATPKGQDIILCQITSQNHYDSYSLVLDSDDFLKGSLHQKSYIRPNKIISIDKSIVSYTIGSIHHSKLAIVIDKIIEVIKQ
ncbi:type II toxin-antitoxin system PemK/MazF family toxin [Bacteroidetes/Chlorobi group bacterium ChocPot_Mid]|jgi:mRNA interferase MazF|nr:MAG: type II toxin-antitoxin system PemK/MazF family toxin [Bacteroidetes/Chlorobi group bacterium ChocPot_Mid]